MFRGSRIISIGKMSRVGTPISVPNEQSILNFQVVIIEVKPGDSATGYRFT
jgi:hypothetical protein